MTHRNAPLTALHDWECVDPGLQLPGVDQWPQDESGRGSGTRVRCRV